MAIRSVRIGISGSVGALIACAVWFSITDQSAKISQRVLDAQADYVASQRAADRGGSVEEMKRRAYAGCEFSAVPERSDSTSSAVPGGSGLLDLSPRYQQQAAAEAMKQTCINSYIYEDGLMYQSPFFLFEFWSLALFEAIAFSAAVGLATGATWKIAALILKKWLGWLSD